MAHYAFLDDNNIVTEVITGIDETELIEGIAPEVWYGNFRNQKCVQTSYNTHGGQHDSGGTPLRKNYAVIGGAYNEELDAFIGIKPFASWTLDEETCLWEAPSAYPTDGKQYAWDESVVGWVEIPTE